MTPQRHYTPQRNINRATSVCRENYCERQVSHQGMDYRESQSSNSSQNSTVNKNSGTDNHMGNGYLKEFTFTDEKGESKTVTAWVPRDN